MDSDLEILEAFRAMELPHAVVATKVDKLTIKEREVVRGGDRGVQGGGWVDFL